MLDLRTGTFNFVNLFHQQVVKRVALHYIVQIFYDFESFQKFTR